MKKKNQKDPKPPVKKTATTIKPRSINLKTQWQKRTARFAHSALKEAHPVVRASYLWSIVSEQLYDILGNEVHRQWFNSIKPLVITDQALVLETPNHFAAQWIHRHYQELVDTLLSIHDASLSAFFISSSDRANQPQLYPLGKSSKGPAPEIKS